MRVTSGQTADEIIRNIAPSGQGKHFQGQTEIQQYSLFGPFHPLRGLKSLYLP